MNLWSSNHPRNFWQCQPDPPEQAWQTAIAKALPSLGLGASPANMSSSSPTPAPFLAETTYRNLGWVIAVLVVSMLIAAYPLVGFLRQKQRGAAAKAQMMFKGIGTGAELWSAELTQWCDGPSVANGATSCPATGAQYIPYQQNIFAGAWYDNSAASPSQATGTQLAQEAIKAAQHFGNTAAGSNRYAYYVILSPTGTNPDNYKSPTQGYCAWHDYTGDGYGVSPTDIAFSNQPYNMDSGSGCGVGFVNSPGTLDQPNNSPREVIIHDDSAVLEVLSFAQDIGCH